MDREGSAQNYRDEYDSLTGLLRPDIFFSKAEKMIKSKPAGSYVMAAIDIDQFKLVNDNYGMEMGDKILVIVGQAIRERVKGEGLVCRIASDCFATLTEIEHTNLGEPEKYNWSKVDLETGFPVISMSVGLYIITELNLLPSAMYDRAVIAKRTIKGGYQSAAAVYDESMRQKILEEREIVKESIQALKEGQFQLYFQPQYRYEPEEVLSAEALVRWVHPKKGVIPPNSFIPVFESNGFICELDRYVFIEALKTIRKWIDNDMKTLPISVNLSRFDVLQERFVDDIISLVEEYKVPIDLIHLEITESAFTTRTDEVIEIIDKLREYGFIVEIDDFGSGYSSLNILKDVKADYLKMDMRFLTSDSSDKRSGIILESCMRMASWLGMHIVAEGVETRQQAEFLNSLNCDKLQGYYYAKPMPLEQYEILVAMQDYSYNTTRDRSEEISITDLEDLWNPESGSSVMFSKYVGPAGLFEWNGRTLGIVRGNPAFWMMIGTSMSYQDISRINLLDNAIGESRQYIIDLLNRVENGNYEDGVVKMNVRRKTGFVVKYLGVTVNCLACGKDMKRFYILFNDVTEREMARENEMRMIKELRRSKDFLTEIINEMFGSYHRIRMNDDGTQSVVIASDSFCYMMNLKREKLLTAFDHFDMQSILHPDDVQKMMDKAYEAYEKPGIRDGIRVRYHRSDGRYIKVIAFLRGVEDGDHIKYMDVYLTDDNDYFENDGEVSADGVVIDTLKRNMNIVDTVIKNIPAAVGVFEYYDDSVFPLYVSDEVLDMFGYTREEFLSNRKTDDMMFSISRVNKVIIDKGGIVEGERTIVMQMKRNNGDEFVARMYFKAVKELSRYKVYAFLEDVTGQNVELTN